MTRFEVTFSVPWVHGWQRAGVNLSSGLHYTKSQTETDEQEIGLRYRQACRARYGRVLKAPRHVPVAVAIDAYAARPKARPRYLPLWLRSRIPFTVKPDADNIAKLMDGLNGIAWHDDAQVTCLTVVKHDRADTAHDETKFMIIWEEE